MSVKVTLRANGRVYEYGTDDLSDLTVSVGDMDPTTCRITRLRGFRPGDLFFHGVGATCQVHVEGILVVDGVVSAPSLGDPYSFTFEVAQNIKSKPIYSPIWFNSSRGQNDFPITCVMGGPKTGADGLHRWAPCRVHYYDSVSASTVRPYMSPVWGPDVQRTDYIDLVGVTSVAIGGGSITTLTTLATYDADNGGGLVIHTALPDIPVLVCTGEVVATDNVAYEGDTLRDASVAFGDPEPSLNYRYTSLATVIVWAYRLVAAPLDWAAQAQYLRELEKIKVCWYFVEGYPTVEEMLDALIADFPVRRYQTPYGYVYRFWNPYPGPAKTSLTIGKGSVQRVSDYTYSDENAVENSFRAKYGLAMGEYVRAYNMRGNDDAGGVTGDLPQSQAQYGIRTGTPTYNTFDNRTVRECLLLRAQELSRPHVLVDVQVPLGTGALLFPGDTVQVVDPLHSVDRPARVESITLSQTLATLSLWFH